MAPKRPRKNTPSPQPERLNSASADETVRVAPCPPPSPRLFSTIVYSPLTHEVILHGGECQCSVGKGKRGKKARSVTEFYDQTYVFKVTVGSGGSPSLSQCGLVHYDECCQKPSARSGHQSVLVFGDSKMVMFGGESSDPYGDRFKQYNDLWVMDTTSKEWTKVTTAPDPNSSEAFAWPGPRSGHRMVSCLDGRCIVLFGGYRDNGLKLTYLNDTWVLSLNAKGAVEWRLLVNEKDDNFPLPTGRSGACMCIIGTRIFMMGGFTSQKRGPVRDLWMLDMRSWFRREAEIKSKSADPSFCRWVNIHFSEIDGLLPPIASGISAVAVPHTRSIYFFGGCSNLIDEKNAQEEAAAAAEPGGWRQKQTGTVKRKPDIYSNKLFHMEVLEEEEAARSHFIVRISLVAKAGANGVIPSPRSSAMMALLEASRTAAGSSESLHALSNVGEDDAEYREIPHGLLLVGGTTNVQPTEDPDSLRVKRLPPTPPQRASKRQDSTRSGSESAGQGTPAAAPTVVVTLMDAFVLHLYPATTESWELLWKGAVKTDETDETLEDDESSSDWSDGTEAEIGDDEPFAEALEGTGLVVPESLQFIPRGVVTIVNSWHFAMLNDFGRNDFYRHCTARAMAMQPQGAKRFVLDLGSGSGILSFTAAMEGADWVVGCDSKEELVVASKAIFSHNQRTNPAFASVVERCQIDFLNKKSTELDKCDFPGQKLPNIITCELFGVLVNGERALNYMCELNRRLLPMASKKGRRITVIPPSCAQFAVVIESEVVRRVTSPPANWNGFDFRPGLASLRNTCLPLTTKELGVHLTPDNFSVLSEPIRLFNISFEDALEKDLCEKEVIPPTASLAFPIIRSGTADAIMIYWEAYSHPIAGSEAGGAQPPLVLSTYPGPADAGQQRSVAWGQCLQLFEISGMSSLPVLKGATMLASLRMSNDRSMLQLIPGATQ